MIDPLILVCAFRYALGRQTYVSLAVSDVIIAEWPRLEDRTKNLFKREIVRAVAEGAAGAQMDVEAWERILALP